MITGGTMCLCCSRMAAWRLMFLRGMANAHRGNCMSLREMVCCCGKSSTWSNACGLVRGYSGGSLVAFCCEYSCGHCFDKLVLPRAFICFDSYLTKKPSTKENAIHFRIQDEVIDWSFPIFVWKPADASLGPCSWLSWRDRGATTCQIGCLHCWEWLALSQLSPYGNAVSARSAVCSHPPSNCDGESRVWEKVSSSSGIERFGRWSDRRIINPSWCSRIQRYMLGQPDPSFERWQAAASSQISFGHCGGWGEFQAWWVAVVTGELELPSTVVTSPATHLVSFFPIECGWPAKAWHNNSMS